MDSRGRAVFVVGNDRHVISTLHNVHDQRGIMNALYGALHLRAVVKKKN